MFKMDDGNFFGYPNNRIVWTDDSYIYNRLNKNPGYIIDHKIYNVESSRPVETETDDNYMTEFGADVGVSYDKDNQQQLDMFDHIW